MEESILFRKVPVVKRAIGGEEFLFLDPAHAIESEDVGRAGLRAVGVFILHPEDGDFSSRRAEERDLETEQIGLRTIGGKEFLLFDPGRAIEAKDVG